MPGIGDEIDGAMQQAPQPARQFIGALAPRGAEWSNPPGNPVVLSADFAAAAS
ncbi:hypothetical protein [Sinimarinibacterium flocculans]|uniref:hypothetical protein n=1 Tax=Sinimarinibacterium flocculans TaxID=985250 RepID=UPI0036D3BA94